MKIFLTSFVFTLIVIIGIIAIQSAGAQQLATSQVSAAVHGEATSSAVAGEDAVNAGINTVRPQSSGQTRSISRNTALQRLSEAISNSDAINEASGTPKRISSRQDKHGQAESTMTGESSNPFALTLNRNADTESQSSASTTSGENGGYPAVGQFPDSTKGLGEVSPPLDYLPSPFIFNSKLGFLKADFDSVPHLNPTYSVGGAGSSSKKPHRSVHVARVGNQLDGNALSDDLNKNSFLGKLGGNAQSEVSPEGNSGLIPDPLADQGSSILGSDQPK